jgi:hypothetical protein
VALTCPACAARRIKALLMLEALQATLPRLNCRAPGKARLLRKAQLRRRANKIFLDNEAQADCFDCMAKRVVLAGVAELAREMVVICRRR